MTDTLTDLRRMKPSQMTPEQRIECARSLLSIAVGANAKQEETIRLERLTHRDTPALLRAASDNMAVGDALASACHVLEGRDYEWLLGESAAGQVHRL